MRPSAKRTPKGLLVSFLVLAIVSLSQSIGVSPCRAAEASGGNFIFILDASGSMGAKIQGRVKMDVAKEALTGLVRELPAGVNVGLTVYGHRQKGDCSDVEELVRPGPPDKESLIALIRGIVPRGMTPITFSVRKVAEGLKGVPGETTIILVSDGEETCKGDPCALVRELKVSGIKFVMHVIGFDVNEKEKAQLACMAKAGGGLYYSARNAGELKVAAQRAVEKKEPPPGKLTLKAFSHGKPLKVYVEIHRAAADPADKREKVSEGWMEKGSAVYPLKAGAYDILVENRSDSKKPFVKFQGVSIEPGRDMEKIADFSGGFLTVKAMRNGRPCRAYCGIYKSQGDRETGEEEVNEGWAGEEGFQLPAGSYDIIVENREDADRPSVSFHAVAVETGKPTVKVAEFSGGSLKVKALRNAQPLRAYCLVYKAHGDEDRERVKVTEGWTQTGGTAFQVTPGVYDLIVENQEDANRPTVSFQGIMIEADGTVEKTADFSGGTLKIVAKRNGKLFSAYCTIFRAEPGGEGEKVYDTWTGAEGAVVQLQPGVYDIVVENQDDAGAGKVRLPGIAIEAGKTVEKTAEFSGGALSVKAIRNGRPLSAFCAIYPAGGGEGDEKREVTSDYTGDEGRSFSLPPGTYDLVVENQDDAGGPKMQFKGIVIEAGKTVEKVVEFTGGTLFVKAMRNGKPLSAFCAIYPAGGAEGEEKREVTSDYTGDEGRSFKLLPGTYDLVVENQDDAGSPKLHFKGIAVEAGKTVEKTAEFSGGTIRIKAVKNGKPFSAFCEIYPAGGGADRRQINGDYTGEDGVGFKLVPGAYDVVVEDQESQKKQEFKGTVVGAGTVLNLDVQF